MLNYRHKVFETKLQKTIIRNLQAQLQIRSDLFVQIREFSIWNLFICNPLFAITTILANFHDFTVKTLYSGLFQRPIFSQKSPLYWVNILRKHKEIIIFSRKKSTIYGVHYIGFWLYSGLMYYGRLIFWKFYSVAKTYQVWFDATTNCLRPSETVPFNAQTLSPFRASIL